MTDSNVQEILGGCEEMTDSNATERLYALLDEFEHECFMIRVEASETRARDDVVRKSYERIRDGFVERIAATVGSGTLTAEQVRSALLRCMPPREYYSVEQTDGWQAIADELNAALGSGECRITASSTDGLCSDNPKHWFKLSCGHSFTVDGLEKPVACAVCGKAVRR